MDTEIIALDWYQSLVDDIRATYTERVFNARWEIIQCYHTIGERIVTDADYQRYANGNGKVLSQVSESTNIAERDLYRSIQFYTAYPDLSKLPDGKNISWHKIVNNLLPAPKETDGRHIPSVTVDIAFDRYKKSALYIFENYPDWFDAMLQFMMDLKKV